MKTIDPGDTFGRWTVTAADPERPDRFICRCRCGEERSVSKYELRRGRSHSCGCLARERMAAVNRSDNPCKLKFDIAGQKFGRWTAISPIRGTGRWLCRCDCGTELAITSVQLRQGKRKSCGCKASEEAKNRFTTHGQAGLGKKTREYRIWRSMIARCTYADRPAWKYYGALGVKVCDRWNSFENFFADMGMIAAPLSIDRIDPCGDYTPENCRLATPREQRMNRRRSNP